MLLNKTLTACTPFVPESNQYHANCDDIRIDDNFNDNDNKSNSDSEVPSLIALLTDGEGERGEDHNLNGGVRIPVPSYSNSMINSSDSLFELDITQSIGLSGMKFRTISQQQESPQIQQKHKSQQSDSKTPQDVRVPAPDSKNFVNQSKLDTVTVSQTFRKPAALDSVVKSTFKKKQQPHNIESPSVIQNQNITNTHSKGEILLQHDSESKSSNYNSNSVGATAFICNHNHYTPSPSGPTSISQPGSGALASSRHMYDDDDDEADQQDLNYVTDSELLQDSKMSPFLANDYFDNVDVQEDSKTTTGKTVTESKMSPLRDVTVAYVGQTMSSPQIPIVSTKPPPPNANQQLTRKVGFRNLLKQDDIANHNLNQESENLKPDLKDNDHLSQYQQQNETNTTGIQNRNQFLNQQQKNAYGGTVKRNIPPLINEYLQKRLGVNKNRPIIKSEYSQKIITLKSNSSNQKLNEESDQAQQQVQQKLSTNSSKTSTNSEESNVLKQATQALLEAVKVLSELKTSKTSSENQSVDQQQKTQNDNQIQTEAADNQTEASQTSFKKTQIDSSPVMIKPTSISKPMKSSDEAESTNNHINHSSAISNSGCFNVSSINVVKNSLENLNCTTTAAGTTKSSCKLPTQTTLSDLSDQIHQNYNIPVDQNTNSNSMFQNFNYQEQLQKEHLVPANTNAYQFPTLPDWCQTQQYGDMTHFGQNGNIMTNHQNQIYNQLSMTHPRYESFGTAPAVPGQYPVRQQRNFQQPFQHGDRGPPLNYDYSRPGLGRNRSLPPPLSKKSTHASRMRDKALQSKYGRNSNSNENSASDYPYNNLNSTVKRSRSWGPTNRKDNYWNRNNLNAIKTIRSSGYGFQPPTRRVNSANSRSNYSNQQQITRPAPRRIGKTASPRFKQKSLYHIPNSDYTRRRAWQYEQLYQETRMGYDPIEHNHYENFRQLNKQQYQNQIGSAHSQYQHQTQSQNFQNQYYTEWQGQLQNYNNGNQPYQLHPQLAQHDLNPSWIPSTSSRLHTRPQKRSAGQQRLENLDNLKKTPWGYNYKRLNGNNINNLTALQLEEMMLRNRLQQATLLKKGIDSNPNSKIFNVTNNRVNHNVNNTTASAAAAAYYNTHEMITPKLDPPTTTSLRNPNNLNLSNISTSTSFLDTLKDEILKRRQLKKGTIQC